MSSLNIRRGSQGGASIVHQVVVPLQYGEHSATDLAQEPVVVIR